MAMWGAPSKANTVVWMATNAPNDAARHKSALEKSAEHATIVQPTTIAVKMAASARSTACSRGAAGRPTKDDHVGSDETDVLDIHLLGPLLAPPRDLNLKIIIKS